MLEFDVQLNRQIYGRTTAAIFVRKFIMVYAIFSILLITSFFNLIYMNAEFGNWSGWIFPFMLIGYFAGFPLAQYFFGFGWKNNPIAGQRTRYCLTEEGLKADGTTYHTFQAWSNFIAVQQIGSAVVLFFTKNSIFILPNTSFQTDDFRRQVVSFIQSRIPIANQKQLKLGSLKRVGLVIGTWIIIIVGVYFVLLLFKH